ncbi:hypothetical protein KAH94_03050 [bacterium]|nr:hypothetical protein [bacterium]
MRNHVNRKIPVTTKCNVLFGGFLNQFGWLFFGFGLIFFWVFAMNADLSFLYFKGNIISIEGVAIDSYETGAMEGETPVFENHYKFTTKDGIEFEEFSYDTGYDVKPGSKLTIEYPEGKPQYSRVKGMRRQMFGAFVLFVVIFPFIGLIFMFFGARKIFRTIRLLKNGLVTKGKLISKKETNVSINDEMVYKMTFRFKDNSGKEHDVLEKTHLPHLLEDDNEEKMLYLEDNPKNAIMLDSLPSGITMNSKEEIEPMPLIKTFIIVIIPLLTVLGNGLYIIKKYF